MFWTKKISVNEWCLVSSVGVLGGGGKNSWVEKDRQAMVVMPVCMYESEEDGKQFDMLQCIIRSLFVSILFF